MRAFFGEEENRMLWQQLALQAAVKSHELARKKLEDEAADARLDFQRPVLDMRLGQKHLLLRPRKEDLNDAAIEAEKATSAARDAAFKRELALLEQERALRAHDSESRILKQPPENIRGEWLENPEAAFQIWQVPEEDKKADDRGTSAADASKANEEEAVLPREEYAAAQEGEDDAKVREEKAEVPAGAKPKLDQPEPATKKDAKDSRSKPEHPET